MPITISELEYPHCVAGAQACPPEDVGGVWGYEVFLKVIRDPTDARYQEMLEWVGDTFDPDDFSPEEIWFADPKERWQFAIGDSDAKYHVSNREKGKISEGSYLTIPRNGIPFGKNHTTVIQALTRIPSPLSVKYVPI